MDVSHSISLDECLLELLDPKTTPEKALHSFSSTCFSPEDYPRRAKEPIVIFLAYMRFIVTRLPDAYVDGIWEKIIKKTVKYSKHCSSSGLDIAQVRRIFPTKVPTDGHEESIWLNKALKYLNKCPNLFTRLELFRLIRIFKSSPCIYWIRIGPAFVSTISDIQPHSLYSNDDADKILFDFLDFNYIIDKCYENGHNYRGTSESYWEVVNVKDPRFLSHCFQLIGIFAINASLLPDSKIQLKRINAVCSLFYRMAISLKSSWRRFDYLISCPCIVETICDITTAIINNKQGDKQKAATVNIRENIVKELDITASPWELPKLMMSHQIQNSVRVHQLNSLNVNLPHQIQALLHIRQHTLLLMNLHQLYNTSEADIIDDFSDTNTDYEDSDEEGAIYEEIVTESEVDDTDTEDVDEDNF